MKILISSLQVSQGASKGHLHPAIEIGLELRQRGHTVAILPLPSPFSQADREQIQRCRFEIIEPPPLPQGLPLSPQELGELAKNPSTTAQAYQSFLVSPLEHQFEAVREKIKNFKPDIIIYDLLVYAAPLAARTLGIPDLGYCAGLKLIAPSALTDIYQSTREKLAPLIDDFLNAHSLEASFHHLELLSSTYQLVFLPKNFIRAKGNAYPANTILAGSLPISLERCEELNINFYNDKKNDIKDEKIKNININKKKNIILCFGSVLDPANYLEITSIIIKIAAKCDCNLIISSRQANSIPSSEYLTVVDYLPLPQLLTTASLFIHHGGANTFSEALTIGVPQLLIPLTTDQPIQAELLTHSQAGIAIYPKDVNEENISEFSAGLRDFQLS
jgi:UDP:flavonoid glycosyltransferase YjiC (YdhE family)